MKIAPIVLLLLLYRGACRLLALVCVPPAVLLARWDDQPTTWTGGAPDNGPLTVRGDLPRWLAWFGTPDERLPGGMYEPTVRRVYNRHGRYWCSVYWLVNRNAMHGLNAALFGRPTTLDEVMDYEWYHVGPFNVGYGWKRYRATPAAHFHHGPFVAVLTATIRF